MEEIDAIIIDSLRNLHCDIEEEITSLKQFDADMVVAAISTCLEVIIPDTTFPKKLPPSMSIKLKIASSLAEQIKELGFREDMGYQTILYCNETEIRRVFMFLVERLPRETSKITHIEQTGYVPCLIKEIERKIKASMEQFWLPTCVLQNGYRRTKNDYIFHSFGDCRPLKTNKLTIPSSRDSYKNEALKQYWIHNVPAVTKQCNQKELIQSLLFKDCLINTGNNYLRNCFIIEREQLPSQLLLKHQDLVESSPIIPPTSQIVAESSIPKSENKIQQLVHELQELKVKCATLEEAVKNQDAKLAQVNKKTEEEDEILKEKLAKFNLKSKTLTVISKEENLAKLKNLIESSKNKLVLLADQWNEIQTPLLQEYKSLQSALNSEDLKYQEEQNRVKKLQETQTALSNDLKEKNQSEDALKQKLEQLNKSHNRSGYTRRILEIIGNIKKQDEEIQKILKDTKELQREISTLTGQVDRSFTLSEELIFRDAKTDETARKAYKLLAQLREECSEIIKAVTDLGAVERECRNLQEQIDAETAKDSAIKLERVNNDLEEIRKENEKLSKKT